MTKKEKKHKGIILAGGQGTRLLPLTKVISKQLLPVYDMPMIFYPLYTLINAGIDEVLIITNPENLNIYKDLLNDGEDFGVKIRYAIQEKPEGIAQAFIISEDWLDGSPCVLILGDNLFLAGNTSDKLRSALLNQVGAKIFGFKVSDPSRYGVVLFDKNNKVLNIEEKPKKPKSNWAITGLYVYDNQVVDFSKKLMPSKRGELEITDLNNLYLDDCNLEIELIDDKSFWLDAGTKESLFEASSIVKDLRDRKINLF
ncbi:sugar phosphate nucleotidyltransferase [Hyphomicrobiales bacterium]|nr:sugar phosphate nucleotidyltransferase [Hyphomicrobiales bacterium]